MKLVSFGVTTVQKGRRITLDDSLLKNLDIKEGDSVELLLDTGKEAIIVKKSQDLSLSFSRQQPKARKAKVASIKQRESLDVQQG
jgi:bifunctional DNA-binding transcriptional regulator/antitoxin component of YhaV-PrlF toxin-antitoxin module